MAVTALHRRLTALEERLLDEADFSPKIVVYREGEEVDDTPDFPGQMVYRIGIFCMRKKP